MHLVDFKRVKQSVTFEQVLAHYGISLKPVNGGELLGLCPFNEDTKPSFRLNSEMKVFHRISVRRSTSEPTPVITFSGLDFCSN